MNKFWSWFFIISISIFLTISLWAVVHMFISWYEQPRGHILLANQTLIDTQGYALPLTIACTGSMRPTINCFSKVYIYKPTIEDIREGDIIFFDSTNNHFDYMLHRVVQIKDGKYYTKGDAAWVRDKLPISFEMIRGKVWRIDYGAFDEHINSSLSIGSVLNKKV